MYSLGGKRLDIYYTTIGGKNIFREGNNDSESNVDKNFKYEQLTPSPRWVVNHEGFGKIPALRVLDSQGQDMIPGIESSTENQTILTFNPPATGIVILN